VPRWGDGELRAMLGGRGVNCDGDPYQADTLGLALVGALCGVCNAGAPPGLVAGLGVISSEQRTFLHALGLRNHPRRTSTRLFGAGYEDGSTAQLLRVIAASPKRKVVVCNATNRGAAKALGGVWVYVPRTSAWADRHRIWADIEDAMTADAIVLYAAGLASAVWAWRFWCHYPLSTQLDVGCIFDAAFGNLSRRNLRDSAAHRDAYEQKIAPLLMGADSC
jgi:hypothetical protein